MTKKITEKRLKWYGDVKRWRGRQKTRWTDSCKRDMETAGLKEDTLDRTKWKNVFITIPRWSEKPEKIAIRRTESSMKTTPAPTCPSCRVRSCRDVQGVTWDATTTRGVDEARAIPAALTPPAGHTGDCNNKRKCLDQVTSKCILVKNYYMSTSVHVFFN